MKDNGIKITCKSAIKKLFKGNISRVEIGKNYSEEFLVKKSLLQWCCKSYLKYNI